MILKAMAGKLKWWKPPRLLALRTAQCGGGASVGKSMATADCGITARSGQVRNEYRSSNYEQVLQLYREQYFDFNVRHFHEKLREAHGIRLQLHVGEDSAARGRAGEETQEAGHRIGSGGQGGHCQG